MDCSPGTGISGFLTASLAAASSFIARTTRLTFSSFSGRVSLEHACKKQCLHRHVVTRLSSWQFGAAVLGSHRSAAPPFDELLVVCSLAMIQYFTRRARTICHCLSHHCFILRHHWHQRDRCWQRSFRRRAHALMGVSGLIAHQRDSFSCSHDPFNGFPAIGVRVCSLFCTEITPTYRMEKIQSSSSCHSNARMV